MIPFATGVDLECGDIASDGMFICRLWTTNDAGTHIRFKDALEQFGAMWTIIDTNLVPSMHRRCYMIVRARANLGTSPPSPRSSALQPTSRKMLRVVAWSEEERTILAQTYRESGRQGCEATFTWRTPASVAHQLGKLRRAKIITMIWQPNRGGK